MQVVNGKEREVVGMLGAYDLCKYEARMYFTLLTIGAQWSILPFYGDGQRIRG